MPQNLSLSKIFFVLITILVPSKLIFSQVSITGPTCVTVGKQYYYNVSGSYNTTNTMQWCVSSTGTILFAYGSNITSTSTCKSGTSIGSIVVTWNSSGSSSVFLNSSDGNVSLNVTVVDALRPGLISSNSSQTISYNSVPSGINCSLSTYGACVPSYTYQWQSSSDNVSWTDCSGQTAQNISFTTPLIQTTYYRRKVTETTSNTIDYSDVATVFVNAPFSLTVLSPASQDLFTGASSSVITGAAASGGSCGGNYTYQWQSSSDGGVTFINITGANSLTYSPGTLSASMQYRRKDVCGSDISYSTISKVNVFQHLSSGTISQSSLTITYNTDPGYIAISNASGGICSGGYTYQWQISQDNITYTDIAGANTYLNYDPGQLTTTTYLHRVVTCGAETAISNAVQITVNPQLFAGSIVPSYSTIPLSGSPGVLAANPASGGNCSGVFNYVWQSSTDGITYNDISGANTQNYTPTNILVTTFYRRKVVCGSDIGYTNVSTVSVNTGSTSSINYVQTRELTKPGVTDEITAAQLTDLVDVKQNTQYLDGLGRSVQTVTMKGSPLEKDVVMPTTYDEFGREVIKYLPYVSATNTGTYKANAIAEQNAFNSMQFPNEQFYYGKTDYEASPLNKVLGTFAPGNSWVGANRGVQSKFLSNTSIDGVRLWTVTDITGNPGTYSTSTTYQAGVLYKDISVDEHGKQVIEFKDKLGKVVLKKVQLTATADDGSGKDHSNWLCTYYIYDDYGSLRAVIQPKGVEALADPVNNWQLSAIVLDELCFRYEYDKRQRMIAKKVPGAGWTYMVYDQRDRLVFTQDANQSANYKWTGNYL